MFYLSRSRMGRHKGLYMVRSNVTGSRGPWCEKGSSWAVNPIKWRVASRTFCHEVIIIRNSLWCGCCTCRHREWEETRGWLGLDPTRSRAHRVRNEERVGPTPHHTTCRFAHVLPFVYIYPSFIYFVLVLLVASANGKMNAAGRLSHKGLLRKNSNEFTLSTSTWYGKKALKVRYAAFTIRNLNQRFFTWFP